MVAITPGGDADSEVTTPSMNVDDTHGYFTSYTDLKVYEGKTVMDVGAGTGILYLFAASFGARKVYAVEASNTAHLCKQIVEQNGFGDRIEVIHSTVEKVDLKGAKVDVIVSEWMGFYLLHESMLDSVIVAQDRFLAPDGIMAPSAARLYVAPVDMAEYLEEKYEFWSNVCGFDFSAAVLSEEPQTLELREDQVVARPEVLLEMDLRTVIVPQMQTLSRTLSFRMHRTSPVHGFALWFDTDFQQGAQLKSLRSQTQSSADPASTGASSSASGHASQQTASWKVVPDSVLSTSPASPVTHWKQTVILLPRTLSCDPADDLRCQVTLTQDSVNKRHYNIELELVGEEEGSSKEDEESDDDDDDGDEHPVPCDCSRDKCQLIRALMQKYSEEQDALETEAELIDLTAQKEAAEAIGSEMG
ncbi:hypothetical protein ACOMHN_064681 [Nucella lapillus]